jgi:hypothetical protein
VKKRTSKYANMNASDLARETRARGLEKPHVLDISQWADWLEEQDNPTKLAEAEVVEDQLDKSADGGQYHSMSNRDLRALAKERGISLHDRTEIIDALQAADGMTEDEQAAQDSGEAS